MYECFHCGCKTVAWDADFTFEDYCEEGEGIIHECHCTNCGALITYRIPLNNEDDQPECKLQKEAEANVDDMLAAAGEGNE